MKVECPLVSVCIITYNSSKYVLEALESVKAQTYHNIELIIADDCSSDNTVEICKLWLSENEKRFRHTNIIVPTCNTGTSANYNRGLEACHGEWIKFLDGDDLLLQNCIEDNINFISLNIEAKVVFSEVLNFTKYGDKETYYNFYTPSKREFFNVGVKEQLLQAMRSNDMASASFFIQAKLIKDNPYDERFRLLEDWPKWIDLLSKGYKFYFFDSVTAMYRRDESVMHSQSRYYSPLFVESLECFFWLELINKIKEYNNQHAYDYVRKTLLWQEFAIAILGNKCSHFNNFLFKCFKYYTRNFIHYKL